ncbi:MAG: Nudix family hydrolase [Candidatus Accumulibacter sp.]|nr:Nudix family hydrolase [Accumulibacter sp.]
MTSAVAATVAATPGGTPVTEVVAAVLLRGPDAAPEFLLAQRPPGKVYAGYWEFPGGKVEPGESASAALRRELREELAIEIDDPWPWLCREFTYPHATVRLKFFRVHAWHGTVAPIEHSALAWMKVGEAPTVAPILPANGPILRALALPARYALTHAEANGCQAELIRLRRALDQGLRLLQVRDKTLPAAERQRFFASVIALAGGYPAARVLINDSPAVAAATVGAHGVHLSSQWLWQIDSRPDMAWVGASCHNASDLARAAELAVDFVVLGPVLPTASHPEATGIGWQRFAELIARCPMPVYALGGMQAAHSEMALRHGAHGLAMMRGW